MAAEIAILEHFQPPKNVFGTPGVCAQTHPDKASRQSMHEYAELAWSCCKPKERQQNAAEKPENAGRAEGRREKKKNRKHGKSGRVALEGRLWVTWSPEVTQE